MHQYTKFFLVTLGTIFMATNGVEAAATAAADTAKGAAAGGAGASTSTSTRPVVALPGFEEADVQTYFANPAKAPTMVPAYFGLSSAPVPERDSGTVLAELLTRDRLGFLTGAAYPTDNFESIFNQLYKLVSYVDALITAHLDLTKSKTTKTGGAVTGAAKPVLPAATALTESDRALLKRDTAKAARAEVDGEIGRLQGQLKAAEAATAMLTAAHDREMAALRAQLASVTEAEVRLKAQIASLEAEVEAAKAMKAKAAEEVAAVAAQKAENDAVRTSEAEARAQLAGLQKRADTLARELDASTATNAELTRKHGEVYGQLTVANVALGNLRKQLANAGFTPVE